MLSFPGVTSLGTPAVTNVPCRHLQGGFDTAGVSKHVTPVVKPSLKHRDIQIDAHTPLLQVCRRLHAPCYKLLICPAEKPRHPMMRGTAVTGGQQGDATWNAFAGIPCQVDGREMPPGTLSQGFRARWTIRSAT